MSFRIWIGVTGAGALLIGAQEVDRARALENLEDCEQVYSSQLAHRAAVHFGRLDSHRWRIMTRRAAAVALSDPAAAAIEAVYFPPCDPKLAKPARLAARTRKAKP